MGYPSLKLYLLDLLMTTLATIKDDPTTVIAEIFEDPSWTKKRRAEIVSYLNGLTISDDLLEREPGTNYLYIIPHFPRMDVAFPQIAITTGNESSSDWGLGNVTGEFTEVFDDAMELVAYDSERGYFASGQWQADIVCKNPIEAEYLSVLCRHVVLKNLDALDAMGVKEVNVSLADLVLSSEMQQVATVDVFARRLTVSAGKVAHTWNERVGIETFQTGDNSAL